MELEMDEILKSKPIQIKESKETRSKNNKN